MFCRRIVFIVGLLLTGTACAVANSADGSTETPAIPVGGLPPTLPTLAPGETSSSTVPRTTVPVPPDQLIGALVAGNRVIMIGDSVMAGTAKRYGGEMCAALVPLGWAVEVDAETAKFIDFGNEVLNERLPYGWDAAVILLGNNYGGDPDVYALYLNRLVEKLAPRPTVLLTVSEYRPEQSQVNTVIFQVAATHDNVTVVDWGAVTGAHPEYLRDDGLHLKDPGRAALAQSVADVFGPAPTSPGKCLGTNFYDDAGGNVNGSTTTVSGSTTPTVPGTDPTIPTTGPTIPGSTLPGG